MTALVVHDLLGGQLLEAEVHHADGSPQGYHYWNRLAGLDVDLTYEQFADGEVVGAPRLIERLRRPRGWRTSSTSSFETASVRRWTPRRPGGVNRPPRYADSTGTRST